MENEKYESDNPLEESFVISPEVGIAVAVERCPLCALSRVPIYCKDCINTGNFSKKSDEYLSYKILKERLQLATEKRRKLVETIQTKVAVQERIAIKRNEIKERKERIEILKQMLSECRQQKEKANKQQSDLRKLHKHNVEKLHLRHSSVTSMGATYRAQRGELRQRQQELERRREAVGDLRCRVIREIVSTIFPIVELSGSSNSLALDDSMTSTRFLSAALSEACQLAYMSGRWVHTDRDGNNYVRIVESSLPGNGDYSAAITSEEMRMHVAAMTDDTSSKADNPTANIVSGLCYTTELVHILANVLHVLLPRRISYSAFGFDDFSEKQLQRAVARLNHNIVHLCCTQRVDPTSIVPTHTLHNLLLVLRSPHLGRGHAYKESATLVQRANEPATWSSGGDDSESENTDWDIISSRDVPDYPVDSLTEGSITPVKQGTSWAHNTATYASAVFGGVHSTSSTIMTSAVASVASLWRTATGVRSDDS